MKTLLHIGTEKTGSTSFQIWAAQNRAALAEHGIWYSRLLGDDNHRKAYLYCLPPEVEDEGFALIGVHTRAERQAFRQSLPAALTAEFAEARAKGCHTFVISNEHCHSRLKTENQVAQMRGLLAPCSDDIQILCYLRPQIDVSVSLASTAARVRLRVDHGFFDGILSDDPYYDYHQLYLRWRAIFGDPALRFISFQKNADTVAYMCNLLGLDPAEFKPVDRLNEALDVQTIALSNAFSDAGYRPDHPMYAFTRIPLELLACTDRVQVGADLARAVQGRFATSNADLAQARPDITTEDLTPKWSRYDTPSNLHILDGTSPFAGKLTETVILMNIRNRITIVNQKIAQVERGIWAKNLGTAARLLRDADDLLASLPATPMVYMAERSLARTRLDRLVANADLAAFLASGTSA